MKYSDEFIRDYLLGKLSVDEERAFEEDLTANAELAEALDLQRDIMVGIKAGFDQQLKAKLSAVDDENKGVIRQLKVWRWASAAAVVLGSLGVYFYMTQTPLHERSYLSHFSDFPNIVTPVQRDTDTDLSALDYLDSGDYMEAVKGLKQLQSQQPEQEYPRFYLGLAYLHLENWHLAIEALEGVRQGSDQRFIEPATWYVMLAYLRSGDLEKTRLLAEYLVSENSQYRKDARAILDRLN